MKDEQQPKLARVRAQNVYFIKLGSAGEWENECLKTGTLRFGYSESNHQSCLKGEWDEVRKDWQARRGDQGAGTRDANQIRIYYEATADDLFITFQGGKLFWCQPTDEPTQNPDGSKTRKTLGGWCDTNINSQLLTTDRISGHLLKVQMFRGTICGINDVDYVLRKINDELSNEVLAAEGAEKALVLAIVPLLRKLTWQDFELLVELVFATSGWRRISSTGGTQKSIDLELILPSTQERAFVQIKSKADTAAFNKYAENLINTNAYQRMFFVWHTGTVSAVDTQNISLLDPEKLARMILDAGLTWWLREKVH